MRATSEIKLSPGTMAYGRNLILVWNVAKTEDGYEYDSLEVPKNSTLAEIQAYLENDGVDADQIPEILRRIENDATGV